MFSDFSIAHADGRVRSNVARNILYSVGLGFAPLFLGFLARIASDGVFESFLQVFVSGELYFYAVSICGSILVVSQVDNHSSNLGMRLGGAAFVAVCAMFMAFYVGQDPERPHWTFWMHSLFSILFLFFAVAVYFRVAVLTQQPPPNPEQVNRERAADLTKTVDPDYDA